MQMNIIYYNHINPNSIPKRGQEFVLFMRFRRFYSLKIEPVHFEHCWDNRNLLLIPKVADLVQFCGLSTQNLN